MNERSNKIQALFQVILNIFSRTENQEPMGKKNKKNRGRTRVCRGVLENALVWLYVKYCLCIRT